MDVNKWQKRLGGILLIGLFIVLAVSLIKAVVWLLVNVLYVMMVSPLAALGGLGVITVLLYVYFKYMDSKIT